MTDKTAVFFQGFFEPNSNDYLDSFENVGLGFYTICTDDFIYFLS